MSEKLKTRREVVMENGRQKPESIESIETLQELGVFIPMRSLDLYHGRAGDGTRWHVVNVNNADNATGNRNINKISALNTGTRDVATAFAKARAFMDDERVPEVYSIVSNDPDVSIIDLRGTKLAPEELEKANQALRKMVLGVFEGSPMEFGEKRVDVDDFKRFANGHKWLVADSDATEYAQRIGIPEGLAWKMCGAANAQRLLSDARNLPFAVDHFMNGTQNDVENVVLGNGKQISFQKYRDADGTLRRAPIDHEYVANWLQKNHVVGAKMRVRSATLGGRQIDNYLLFDYEKVNTENYYDERKKRIESRLGAASLIGGKIEGKKGESEVLDAINDLYASPKEVLDAVKKIPGYKDLFDSEVGVWEKYTLGEHTETVLGIFERNYADKMHAKVIPLVKLSLLVHDIGKPLAVAKGEKGLQKDYNVFEANKFMEQIGVDVKDRWLVMRLIGEGMEMTEDWVLRGSPGAGRRFFNFCKDTIQRYGRYEPDWDEITGLRDICLVLQTCDSAAYTDMAITRASKKGLYFKNSPSFNRSFENDRKGLDGRGARLKWKQ